MTNLEMIDALRQKYSISYDEAKAALEENNWDYAAVEAAMKNGGSASRAQSADRTDSASFDTADRKVDFKSVLNTLWLCIKWIVLLACSNNFVLTHGKKTFMRIPVIIMVLLLIFGFWWTLLLLVIGLALGLHYTFEGPVLGTEKANGVMQKINDFADKLRSEVIGKKN